MLSDMKFIPDFLRNGTHRLPLKEKKIVKNYSIRIQNNRIVLLLTVNDRENILVCLFDTANEYPFKYWASLKRFTIKIWIQSNSHFAEINLMIKIITIKEQRKYLYSLNYFHEMKLWSVHKEKWNMIYALEIKKGIKGGSDITIFDGGYPKWGIENQRGGGNNKSIWQICIKLWFLVSRSNGSILGFRGKVVGLEGWFLHCPVEKLVLKRGGEMGVSIKGGNL